MYKLIRPYLENGDQRVLLSGELPLIEVPSNMVYHKDQLYLPEFCKLHFLMPFPCNSHTYFFVLH